MIPFAQSPLRQELGEEVESPGAGYPPGGRIRTATPSSVRAVNRAIILELIRRRQPISRADLARATGIFRSSVSEIVDELVEDNLVSERRGQSTRGRTPMSLSLNEDKVRVLGLNIRPDHCRMAVAGLSGAIQHTVRFTTPMTAHDLVNSFVQAVHHLEFEVDDRVHRGYGRVGIAVPGHVDTDTGRILWIPTHPDLAAFDIAGEISQRLNLDVRIDNDCNLGALSELWLADDTTKDLREDFAFLNVSDFGAGAGTVIGGELYRGHDSKFVAEFGHMIIDPHGPLCPCGRHGCWERFICNTATWDRYRPGEEYSEDRFVTMLTNAESGDETARKSLREMARYLALGLSNMALALNPSVIVVAGRVTAAWEYLRPAIDECFATSRLEVPVRPARLSADDSLLHGAVCLALRDIFAAPRFG